MANKAALFPGNHLTADDKLVSHNKRFSAQVQPDGAFAVVDSTTGESVWTSKPDPGRVSLSKDGRLVVTLASGQVLWKSDNPAAPEGSTSVFLTDEGNLAIVSHNGKTLWSSNSAQS